MTDVIRVLISGVDRGPAGTNIVQSISVQPAGPDRIGLGRLVFLKGSGGGGLSFLPMEEIIVDRWNGAHATTTYFMGFLGRMQYGRLPGTTTKRWYVDVFDPNVLRKRLVTKAGWAPALHLGAGTFENQLQQVLTYFGTGASKAIDPTGITAGLFGATVLPAAVFQGWSLDRCVQQIITTAVATDPTVAPIFLLQWDRLNVWRSNDLVWAFCYDANSPPVSVATLDDTSTGHILLEGDLVRTLDPVDLVNWRQSTRQSSPVVKTSSSAASIAAYPNPYDVDGAWKDEPYSDTVSTTDAEQQAQLDAVLATTAYPRETYDLTTDVEPPPLPGQYVTLSDSINGVVAGVYQVAGSGIEFTTKGDGTYWLRTRLALGLPRLELGQTPSQRVAAPAVAVPPEAPTGLACVSTFQPTRGDTLNHLTWAAPGGGITVVGYRIYATTPYPGGQTWTHYCAGAGTLAFDWYVAPNNTFGYTVRSVGVNGLESADSNLVSLTSAPVYAPDAPVAPYTVSGGTANGKAYAKIDFTLPGTTHGPHDHWQVEVSLNGVIVNLHLDDGANAFAWATDLVIGLTYSVRIRTRSDPSWYGAWTAPISVRIGKPGWLPGSGEIANDTVTIAGWGPDDATAILTDLAVAYGTTGTWAFTPGALGSNTLTSVPVAAQPGQVWSLGLAYKRDGFDASVTLYWDWYDALDGGGALISTTTTTCAAATTSWQTKEAQVTAPANTQSLVVRLTVATVALSTLWVALYRAPAPATLAAQVGPGAIRDPAIATGGITDPTKLALKVDSATNRLTLYDQAGQARGDLYYASANAALKLDGLAVGPANTGWRLSSSPGDVVEVGRALGLAGIRVLPASGADLWLTVAGGGMIQLSGGSLVLQGVKETRGSSFPGSPASGDRYYRTDLGLWAYYDGSRWLSEEEFPVGGWVYYPAASAAAEISASQEYAITALRSDYALYLTRWELFGYVNGTNDGTKYWTVELRTFSGLVTVATHSTAAWSGTTWTRATAITSFTQPATTDYGLELNVTKVSTPGNLRFYFALYARLVLT